MKIFTAQQIRNWDAYTISKEPIASIDLMERASLKAVEWLLKNIGVHYPYKIFCGPGNNGGDGLAIARLLVHCGARVTCYAFEKNNYAKDFKVNLERLETVNWIKGQEDIPTIDTQDIVVDAIFGSGLNQPVKGLFAAVINRINQKEHKKTIAIDIPSGLYADQSTTEGSITQSDHTLTFQRVKLAFLFPENHVYVGEWSVLNIGLHTHYEDQEHSIYQTIDKSFIEAAIKPRKKFSHKGTFGHALLVVGGEGKLGAGIFATEACIRSGVGLVTACIPKSGEHVYQSQLPDAMVSFQELDHSNFESYKSIGCGPGLGTRPSAKKMVGDVIESTSVPLVLDADALNLLASTPQWYESLRDRTILTPHLGEFKRLFGEYKQYDAVLHKQVEAAQEYGIYIILKGAHTSIATPKGELFFNFTGNPVLSKGGSGDVLTGYITGLLAQGYSLKEACLIGVFKHGEAGDLALQTAAENVTISSILKVLS